MPQKRNIKFWNINKIKMLKFEINKLIKISFIN